MRADLEIDALGLLCPLPVLRLRKRMAELDGDSVVRLLADDPAAAIDVPHFCQESAHTFLGSEPLDNAPSNGRGPATAYYIRKA